MPALDIRDLANSGAYSFPTAPSASASSGAGNCPDGYYWDGRRCSLLGPLPPGDAPHQCPAGTHWEYGQCVDDTPGGEGDCPPGEHKDAAGNCTDCPPGEGRLYPGGPCQGGTSAPAPTPAAPAPSGGGTAAPAPRPFAFSGQVNDFNALLEKMIREGLAAPSRFTPEALQSLYGQITQQASGRIARGSQAVRAEAARRGMQRAGSTAAALRGVRDVAETERGSANVNVQLTKINADYQDKVAALDRAQRYLDSLRDSEYRMLLASEQRRQYDANLALSYAQLAQQRSLLEMQLQSEWDKLRALIGFQLLGQGI